MSSITVRIGAIKVLRIAAPSIGLATISSKEFRSGRILLQRAESRSLDCGGTAALACSSICAYATISRLFRYDTVREITATGTDT
jgi:hypothetical protein